LDLFIAIAIVLTALLTAMAALSFHAAVESRRPPPPTRIFSDDDPGTVFLFDGERLVDSSPRARALLSSLQLGGGPWPQLVRHLSRLFPELEAQLATLGERGALCLVSAPDAATPTVLRAEDRSGLIRLELTEAGRERGRGTDPFTLHALMEEIAEMRQLVAEMPGLAWRTDARGEIIWCNGAYMAAATALLGDGNAPSWPPLRLFDDAALPADGSHQRARLVISPRDIRWYDLTAGQDGPGGQLCFATPADALVRAETTLRELMQTLTKTFAQLPIGLAIFDHHRKLQLFNPAMLDLTGLAPDFLMLKPSLISVLDALRDRRMLPEPKDYHVWRRELVNMERAASEGLYQETWNLPDGQVFRVTGQPHPDGALALMFEDVSSEILRTRRYRADLELGQSVIDSMEEAVAVFSPEGHLVMTNRAYGLLWGHDPAEGIGAVPFRRVAAQWRSMTAPGPLWHQVEDFLSTFGDRQGWAASTRLADGRELICRFVPLAGGATLSAFRIPANAIAKPARKSAGGQQRAGNP